MQFCKLHRSSPIIPKRLLQHQQHSRCCAGILYASQQIADVAGTDVAVVLLQLADIPEQIVSY